MARRAKVKRRAANTAVRRTTMVAFTAEDLNVLAKVLKPGQV